MDLTATLAFAITALIGAAIGGSIAEAREFLKALRTRRELIAEVLYWQLRVLNSLKAADIESAVHSLGSAIARRFGVPEGSLRPIIEGHGGILQGLLQQMRNMVPHDLGESYQNAVQNLARVEPLLAYGLSGRRPVNELHSFLTQLLNSLKLNEVSSDQPTSEVLNDAMAGEVQKLAEEAVRKDIARLEPYLTRRHRRELGPALERIDNRMRLTTDEDIEGYWKFMGGVATKMSAAGQPGWDGLAMALGSRQGVQEQRTE